MFRGALIAVALLLAAFAVRADGRRPLPHGLQPAGSDSLARSVVQEIPTDTLNTRVTEYNQRLYDSIAAKTSRRAVPHMLYRWFFVRPVLDTTSSGRVVDESRIYAPYAGRTIDTIRIERRKVFDRDSLPWIERAGNSIHVMTRERVIRRDLLFREGDAIDPELLVRNQQLLRSRDYISDAGIELVPVAGDSTRVEVIVRTRDSWTISADMGLHSSGRTMFGVSDANILGTGNLLNIKTHFDRRNFDYGGNIFEYRIPNVLGSFYRAEFSAGRAFYTSELKVGLRKDFIKPTDYEVGVTYNDLKTDYYRIDLDTTTLVKSASLDVWAGRSRFLPRIRSSIFFTGRYGYTKYSKRPEVAPDLNPAFHNTDNLLFGLGLYRERFLSANMVYGFGTREYLATGYKAELVGGYSWGEFNEDLYMGFSYKAGGFTRVGYLMGGYTIGSFIDPHTGTWSRSAIDVDLRWFSNLFLFRRNRIRQFLGINYTHGWNRLKGSDESIRFTRTNGLQALEEHAAGINRAVLNTETVVFTPYQPFGFRIALFGFADFGLLGYSPNLFKNEFFTSFGFGIRIRNERLIFKAIQLRLGIAFGKHGLAESQYFRISNQTRLEQYRYLPARPEIVRFQ